MKEREEGREVGSWEGGVYRQVPSKKGGMKKRETDRAAEQK